MTTCLTHDQINDKRKIPILSEETFLESEKLFKKNFQSRSLNTCCELDSMSELSVFVYIKSHLTLYVKSTAQKVNLIRLVHKLNNNRLCLTLCPALITVPSGMLASAMNSALRQFPILSLEASASLSRLSSKELS